MSYILLTMFLVTIGYAVHVDIRKDQEYRKERETWHVERQQLLDRIQAPSYDHLKHHEAKIIKASKDPLKEPNTLEVV